VEDQEEGAQSLLDQMNSTAGVVLVFEFLPNDGCSRTLEEQVLGWFARLDVRPIVDPEDH
jgi:hypothetical protein